MFDSMEFTKNNTVSKTNFNFTRGLRISICCLSKLLLWLYVLKANGITSGSLLLTVLSNLLQANQRLEHDPYRRALRSMCSRTGINDKVGEHSVGRGGAGFCNYMLRWDLFFIFRSFKWQYLQNMLLYIGIEDK